MYRPKQVPNTIHLPRLTALPGLDDVTKAMQQARDRAGTPVELSWHTSSNYGVSIYRLVVTCSRETGEVTWNLLVGEGREEVQAWTYSTGDIALVLNLVLSESTSSMQDAANQSFLLGESNERNAGMAGSYSTSLMGLQSITSSSTKLPVFQASRALRAPTMEGTLEDMPIPTLLQSIAMGKMTGKLTITNEQTGAELFFVEGELVHAQVLNLKGDLAIMELVTWDSGRFFFYRDERTDQKTVAKRVDAILMESVTLLDQSKFLLDSGLKMESYITKKDAALTEAEFEERVKKRGAPCDIALQKQFYLRLDGNSTLFDILRERPMVKKDWVPVLFNMLKCDLVSLSEKPQVKDKASLLESTALDRAAIDGVIRSLKRSDTGIISYPVFQYFIEHEFSRFQFYANPFSVIIFEIWLMGEKLEALPVQATAEMAKRIGNVKRSIDTLAHFETLNYALLLPNTETASAAILAHRILEVLTGSALVPGGRKLAVAFGIAGIPEDCRDVGLLLSAAKVAKNVAQRSEFPIIMFKDLQAPQP